MESPTRRGSSSAASARSSRSTSTATRHSTRSRPRRSTRAWCSSAAASAPAAAASSPPSTTGATTSPTLSSSSPSTPSSASPARPRTTRCATEASPWFDGLTISGGVPSLENLDTLAVRIVNGPDIETDGIDFRADFQTNAGPGRLTLGASGTATLSWSIDGWELGDPYDAKGRLNYDTSLARALPGIQGPPLRRLHIGPLHRPLAPELHGLLRPRRPRPLGRRLPDRRFRHPRPPRLLDPPRRQAPRSSPRSSTSATRTHPGSSARSTTTRRPTTPWAGSSASACGSSCRPQPTKALMRPPNTLQPGKGSGGLLPGGSERATPDAFGPTDA